MLGDNLKALTLGKWPKLSSLVLERCNLDEHSMMSLRDAPWQPECVNVNNNCLIPQSIYWLCTAEWPKMQELHLNYVFSNVVTCNDGIMEAAESNEPFDPAFWQRFSNAAWPELHTLSACAPGLNSVSTECLVQCCWPQLRQLDLSAGPLTPASLAVSRRSNWPLLENLLLQKHVTFGLNQVSQSEASGSG